MDDAQLKSYLKMHLVAAKIEVITLGNSADFHILKELPKVVELYFTVILIFLFSSKFQLVEAYWRWAHPETGQEIHDNQSSTLSSGKSRSVNGNSSSGGAVLPFVLWGTSVHLLHSGGVLGVQALEAATLLGMDAVQLKSFLKMHLVEAQIEIVVLTNSLTSHIWDKLPRLIEMYFTIILIFFLNFSLLRLTEGGIIQRLGKKYMTDSRPPCPVESPDLSMGILQVAGLYFLLFCGVLLSTSCMLLEFWVFKHRQQPQPFMLFFFQISSCCGSSIKESSRLGKRNAWQIAGLLAQWKVLSCWLEFTGFCRTYFLPFCRVLYQSPCFILVEFWVFKQWQQHLSI